MTDSRPDHMEGQHVDDRLDRLVAEHTKDYSIDAWLQPRSMVQVQLAKLKDETRCPMCFGKIRSARISMVCLHRYCAKCIEQYLRAKVPGRHGDDKECPVCRAHLHSRRATKPDPVFDKIIQALYGDVDQFDAEEEALIEQDNKAHVAAWQAQLAELKARQAAAVAAARGPLGPPSAAAAAAAGAAGRLSSGPGALDAYGTGPAAGLRKRSAAYNAYDDDEDEDEQRYGGAARFGGGRPAKVQRLASGPGSSGPGGSSRGGTSVGVGDGARAGAPPAAAAAAAAAAAGTGGGGRRSSSGAFAAGVAADGEPGGGALALLGAGSLGSGKKKKKRSMKEVAARMLGLAAQAAAAAAPPARVCVVHVMPASRQAAAACGADAPAAAGRPEGRSRKQGAGSRGRGGAGEGGAGGGGLPRPPKAQPLQQIAPGQVVSPEVEQPFLACPWGLQVGDLKQQLLQQLLQQGTVAGLADAFELQLMQPVGLGSGGAGSSGSSGSSASKLLQDDETVGQLHEQSGVIGPDLLLTYQLLGV